MDLVDLLLRSIYDLKKNRNGEIYRGVGQITMILKELKIETTQINDIQRGINQLQEFTEGAFYFRKKWRQTNINTAILKDPLQAAEMLFDIYEEKLVTAALPKRLVSVGEGMKGLLKRGGSSKRRNN
mmetsp:Transcript_11774/g.13394  ORF Transcript_11774/g.13394 Transcript_11774/m.13394 type:complete len:127 (-) Transcript_11774:961-1341(-)